MTKEELDALMAEAKSNPPTGEEIRAEMARRVLYLIDQTKFTPDNLRKLYGAGFEPELRWKMPGAYAHAAPMTTEEALRHIEEKERGPYLKRGR